MKTLKAIMAIAMVIILASCGGKGFDADKAQKLCDKYESEGLTEKEWNEFASLYESLNKHYISLIEKGLEKAKKGMTMSEVEQLCADKTELEKLGKIAHDMEFVSYDGSRDMPADVRARIKASKENLREESSRIEQEIRKKIED